MKKFTFFFLMLFLIGINLSMKAQTAAERIAFYKYYKTAVSDKTAIINADPVLYQQALNSGWFQQAAAGLKNAEAFANGNNWNNGGSPQAPASENGTCATATPFCTAEGDTYPAGVNTGTAESGPYYSCLSSQPNPAWLYMKILIGGDLHITETNSNDIDVDFILWGPFTSPTCGSALNAGKVVDCSYSPVATEYIDIASCVAGQYYMLLVTNFSNNATNITLAKTGGSAETDCAITQVPRPPVTSAGTNITGTSFSANWTGYPSDPYPATSFVLDVSTDPAFGSFVGGFNNFDVGLATTWPITGLSPGGTYYYRLRGVNANGQSANSTRITVMTLSCINPTSGGSIAADQTQCDTFTPATFTSTGDPTGETGTLEYKWQSSVSPFSTWSDLPSSNSASYAPGSISVTTKYKRLARVNCMSNWTGAAESNVVTATVNPLPAAFNVTGGTFCAGTSGIGLSGSAAGISYALYRGATLVSTLAGTGASLDFGIISVAGTYTVVATNTTTLCTNNMTGSSLVNPLPEVFTVTGGTFCATHSSIGLSGSVAGFNYGLYNGATLAATLPGTGAALDFGIISVAGTYTVLATNATTFCTNNMTGSSLVNPLPTPVMSGASTVTQGQTVTYSTPYYPGHLYSWNASHGNPVLCFPNRNCLTITWDFPCGIINPGFVTVTETIQATGCSATVTKAITITQ